MLDLSKARRRRSIYVPVLMKFFFLCLPWIFVGYGGLILQDSLAFYNNSVSTSAEVVLAKPTDRPTSPDAARSADLVDDVWYRPGFLYVHENGETYVGGALVESVNWPYRPGQIVDIRYNRVAPEQAQPVTILKFWWSPASFMIGGVIAFIALATAFWIAERDPNAPVKAPRQRARKTSNLLRFRSRVEQSGFRR